MGSMPLYAALPALTEAVVEAGWTRVYSRIADVGLPRYLAYFAAYMACVEFFVYWMHRGLHDVKLGYRRAPAAAALSHPPAPLGRPAWCTPCRVMESEDWVKHWVCSLHGLQAGLRVRPGVWHCSGCEASCAACMRVSEKRGAERRCAEVYECGDKEPSKQQLLAGMGTSRRNGA